MSRFFSLVVIGALFFPRSLSAQESTDKSVVSFSDPKNTEFAPTISGDGRLMVFESDVDKIKGWELFEVRMNEVGNWMDPEPIASINERCSFLAGPSLSYDGNTLYFTAFIENVSTSEDIYYSERLEGNTWSEPKSIGAPINTPDSYEGFPSISSDGNSMYFIRTNAANFIDKKSKENCFVIYVSHLKHDGTWGAPKPLPSPINTGCERDPKIMADNHTLIFSSIREGGKGKYDLFQSRKLPDSSWTQPVALDYVNSSDNDQSPCISASGSLMYYYSHKDIYSVTIPKQFRQMVNVTIKGKVLTDKDVPLKAKIVVHEYNSSETFEHESSPIDGAYLLVLSAGKKYTIDFIHDGFVNETLVMDFENQDKYTEIIRRIVMKSTYTLSIIVDDGDMKTPLNSFVSVTSPGQRFEDSIKHNQYPYKVKLNAGIDYTLKAVSPEFPAVVKRWKYDQQKIKSEMTDTIHLIREKVRYTTDVTHIVSKQKSKINVYFNNDNVNEVIIAESGETVLLRKGDHYQVMTGSDKGYFFSSTEIVAGAGTPDSQGGFVVSMNLVPIQVGAQLTLNHITFAFNSDNLNPSSRIELDRVLELMQKNPSLHIEISAHTDDVGSAAYNLKLSQSRAISAVNYLKQNGASVDRLKHVGLGKSKPIVPNNSEENRAINRRIELRVLKFE